MLRTIAVAAAVTLASVVGLPSAAFASAPNPGFATSSVTFLDGGTSLESVLPVTFAVGDCLMTYGSVELILPDSGTMALRWTYDMYTKKTSNFDQWHSTWRFRD